MIQLSVTQSFDEMVIGIESKNDLMDAKLKIKMKKSHK
jgi:hypothetical protein